MLGRVGQRVRRRHGRSRAHRVLRMHGRCESTSGAADVIGGTVRGHAVGSGCVHVPWLTGSGQHIGALHKSRTLYIAVLHSAAARRCIQSRCANGVRGGPAARTSVVRGGHLVRRASLIIRRLDAHRIVCLHIIFHHDCIGRLHTIIHQIESLKEKSVLQQKDTRRTKAHLHLGGPPACQGHICRWTSKTAN